MCSLATTKKDLIVENMPDSELLELAGVPDLINNLLSEKCDGVFLDGGVALGYIENTDGLVAAEGIEIGEGDRIGGRSAEGPTPRACSIPSTRPLPSARKTASLTNGMPRRRS